MLSILTMNESASSLTSLFKNYKKFNEEIDKNLDNLI